MKQRRAFDQPDLFRMNQPNLQLRVVERTALAPLVRSLLLEVLLGRTSDMSGKENEDD
jgi:hypothetical protein